MSKNKFRLLIVASLMFAILGETYDYIWPDKISEQIIEFAYELEPEIDGAKMVVLSIIGLAAIIFGVVSFFGLLLFRSWARPMYLAGFIILLPTSLFYGVSINSGVSQVLGDLSLVTSGIILAMLYYSPVSDFYQRKNKL